MKKALYFREQIKSLTPKLESVGEIRMRKNDKNSVHYRKRLPVPSDTRTSTAVFHNQHAFFERRKKNIMSLQRLPDKGLYKQWLVDWSATRMAFREHNTKMLNSWTHESSLKLSSVTAILHVTILDMTGGQILTLKDETTENFNFS